ncbi:MAG TPA: glycosyltransferase family 39 protein, partial [Patescibacteria group bacterium]
FDHSRIILNSPDETAHYFFSRIFAEETTLQFFEPLNFLSNNGLKPRSVKVINGYLTPGGFIGLNIIYGSLAKIFGVKAVYFFTPFMAALAVLFFYGLIKIIFDQRIAFVSALLLLIQPAFWYYASRGLLPNVLLVSLLIIGFYFLLKAFEISKIKVYWQWLFAGLAGGLISLALTVRPTEYLWVGLILITLFFGYIKRLSFIKIFLFLVAAFLAFCPVFYHNTIVYGQPYLTGYSLSDTKYALQPDLEERPILTGEFMAAPPLLNQGIWKFVYPFKFHPNNIIRNFVNFYLKFFWWLNILAAVGLIIYLVKYGLEKSKIIYLALLSTISAWLIVYYGTWLFFDNITPDRITIGTSYVRYWLPSFILSLPLISLVILYVLKVRRLFFKILLGVVLGAAILLMNARITLWQGEESLRANLENLLDYQRKAENVFQLTPPEAVIITNRTDKLFFPERRVMFYVDNDFTIINHLNRLLDEAPIYWFTMMPNDDIVYVNSLLEKFGLVLTNPEDIIGEERLFEVQRIID